MKIAPTPNPTFVVHTTEAEAEPMNDQMTDEQSAQLRALCEDLGEPFDTNLTRHQADERIAALRERKS